MFPVIEEFAQGNEERVIASSLNGTTEERENNYTAQERIEPDLQRVLVKAGQDLEPAGGVMNLVQRAPKELRFVAITMPPVVNECGKNVDD